MDISTLEDRGFVSIEYPSKLREDVSVAMAAWIAFCGLPKETKLQLGVPDRHIDDGYNFREDTGEGTDAKEFFHVKDASARDQLTQARASGLSAGIEFLENTQTLIQSMRPLIEDFALSLEKKYCMLNFARDVMENSDNWIFRYIHYFGGETLAHAHPDRAGFTMHLAESAPGGEYLPINGTWRAWPVSEKETIIFPSMLLQHRSRCALKALWHRVKPTEQTSEGGRYALVAFIDFRTEYEYDDKHGRLAEKPEGFNWHMPTNEFNQFFKKRL